MKNLLGLLLILVAFIGGVYFALWLPIVSIIELIKNWGDMTENAIAWDVLFIIGREILAFVWVLFFGITGGFLLKSK